MSAERLAAYHEYSRKHGVNWPLYLLARIFITPFLLVYFRYSRAGRKFARGKGGLIVASNHRSFLDPFIIGGSLPWSRPMNYVAKVELFRRPLQGWILSRLRRLPDPARRIRRGLDGDGAPDRRARRHRLHFPRGHEDPPRHAREPEARRRPARPADRRAGPPGRRPGDRRRAPRMADLPAQGEGAAGQGDDLPPGRGALPRAG